MPNGESEKLPAQHDSLNDPEVVAELEAVFWRDLEAHEARKPKEIVITSVSDLGLSLPAIDSFIKISRRVRRRAG